MLDSLPRELFDPTLSSLKQDLRIAGLFIHVNQHEPFTGYGSYLGYNDKHGVFTGAPPYSEFYFDYNESILTAQINCVYNLLGNYKEPPQNAEILAQSYRILAAIHDGAEFVPDTQHPYFARYVSIQENLEKQKGKGSVTSQLKHIFESIVSRVSEIEFDPLNFCMIAFSDPAINASWAIGRNNRYQTFMETGLEYASPRMMSAADSILSTPPHNNLEDMLDHAWFCLKTFKSYPQYHTNLPREQIARQAIEALDYVQTAIKHGGSTLIANDVERDMIRFAAHVGLEELKTRFPQAPAHSAATGRLVG